MSFGTLYVPYGNLDLETSKADGDPGVTNEAERTFGIK
jgi:hypothetical protein